jgi:hypothetical protein
MKSILTVAVMIITACFCQNLSSQNIVNALRINEPLKVDGVLDEAVWADAEIAKGFLTWQPTPGLQPNQDTEVKILYNDEALYIGAHIHENSRDDIMTELSQRDEIGNTDWFGVILDTYGNGTDAAEFIVGSTGVQFDAKLSEHNEDTDWDAVWFNEVTLTENGWFVEMMIPYSAIRFPKMDVQEWKVNFMRFQAKNREKSSWNPIDPKATSFLTQVGILTGIKNIKPPLRLSLSPYVSTYFQHSRDKQRDPITSSGYSYNGGLDLKYGITDAFTLDMTLIPDFGQVRSDDQVLNLSPFEIRFSENRPFFTEGTEIFTKGNLFYTRRVGGRPIGMYDVEDHLGANEEILENPEETQLYNASKLSGRTSKGLGIGVFNAIAGSTHAKILNNETNEIREFETGPLTNYNVFVLDQNLKNNSYVSFINTSVLRKGSNYYNANVTGTSFNIKNKKQTVGISGSGSVSQLYYTDQEDVLGFLYNVSINKLTGNWRYGIWHGIESDKYDRNDLGFISQNNDLSFGLNGSYSFFEPFWKLNRGDVWFNINYSSLYSPREFTSVHFNLGWWVETKGFWNFNMWYNYRPDSYDFYEPRVDGRFYKMPAFYNTGFWFGSDNRKKLRIQGSGFVYNVTEKDRYGYELRIAPRYRFTDRFTMSLSVGPNVSINGSGYVNQLDNSDIIFGKRNQTTVSNVLLAQYSFSDKMGLDLRIRHYWSKLYYNDFFVLNEEGGLDPSDYDNFEDFSFTLFNLDLTYKWRFAPGSDLILVWKNNIAGSESNEEVDYRNVTYSEGIGKLDDYAQNNSFSLRFVYYLDFARI